LKTQVFSQKLYKQYEAANPAIDSTFVRLHELLGNPLDPTRVEALNKLIVEKYGKQRKREEAAPYANERINHHNSTVNYYNNHETWCPEVKYPLLNDVEDKANADLIREILIRYATVPRTITKREFKSRIKNYMPN
jgi:hypothetical protein